MTRRVRMTHRVGMTRKRADRRRLGPRIAQWLPPRPLPPSLSAAPALRPERPGAAQLARDLLSALRRRRRLLATGLFAIAVAMAIDALAPKPPVTVTVVAAAHDLPAGAILTAADVRSIALPPAVVPSGAITAMASTVGRQLSGPLREGEPLTDVRIDDGVLRVPGAGLVSVPVRLADSQAARLLQPGQRIDVLAASASTELPSAATTAETVASGTVVAIPPAAISTTGSAGDATGGPGSELATEGTLVVVATTSAEAHQLAQAQVSARLSAVVVG